MGFDMIRNADAGIRKIYFKKTALSDGIGFNLQDSAIGHRINGIKGQV